MLNKHPLMKRKLFLWLAGSLVFSFVSVIVIKKILKEQREEESEELYEEEENEEKEATFIEARARYEFDLLKDPETGKIPAGIFEKEIAYAKTLPVRGSIHNPAARVTGITTLNNYLPAGPNNIGGRTRALAYDLRYNGNSNQVIISGSVSGGIMRSSNGGTNWVKVSPEEDTHSFTVIAQDPREGFQDTWYAAGGEPYGNTTSDIGATYLGYGLWKSVNNGISWTKLALNNVTELNGTSAAAGTLETFDHPFDYVHKVAINPTNGDVYVAGHRRLLRSTNGGSSFQTVFGSTVQANAGNGQMDVAIANTGIIMLAVNGGNPDANLKGIWLSNTGNASSFIRIAGGQTLAVDSIPNWRGNDYSGTSKRVLIALAPSNQSAGYVFYENGLSSESPGAKPEADLFRFDISGNTITWVNRSANMPDFPNGDLEGSDPLTVQNGYNMVLAVKPNDPNTVIIGGTNLYRSTDGFASTSNTAWINGYSTSFTYQQYPNGHPDQHSITFNPSNPNQVIVGDDGGIRSGNISSATVSWNPLPNYQTVQYYYVAIDPQEGKNNFAGGAQDNGALLRDKARVMGTALADSNNHVRLIGGDGGAVGIAKPIGDQFLYGSSQLGEIRRIRLTSSFSSNDIKPDNLTENDEGGFGEFVTNFRLNPDNTEDLYYVNFNRLFRTTSASTVTSGTWTELVGVRQAVNPSNPGSGKNISIRAMAFTRGAYSSANALFLGTTDGKILRLDDPRNAPAASAPVNITPLGLIGNVQDIAVNPINDNEVLAIVSNYNVVNIWLTNNAKSATPAWRNVEGNLALPSIRSCQIVINTSGDTPVTEYYVGTSVGLYSTNDLSGSPVWQREGGNTLGFAVVQSLAHRPVDNALLIGTHGNGMYYTFVGRLFTVPAPGTEVFITSLAPTLTSGAVNYIVGNLTTVQKIDVRVFNMQGQLVFREERGYDNASINFSRYAAGMYIVSITSGDGKYKLTEKVIKQ
jgi:hypothetical protein